MRFCPFFLLLRLWPGQLSFTTGPFGAGLRTSEAEGTSAVLSSKIFEVQTAQEHNSVSLLPPFTRHP